jgi:hypothetical protein
MWNLNVFQGVNNIFEISANMSLLTSTTGTNRDIQGFDFVDFLDTWTCSARLTTPGANSVLNLELHAIVNDSLQFPYDYAPPCTPQ